MPSWQRIGNLTFFILSLFLFLYMKLPIYVSLINIGHISNSAGGIELSAQFGKIKITNTLQNRYAQPALCFCAKPW